MGSSGLFWREMQRIQKKTLWAERLASWKQVYNIIFERLMSFLIDDLEQLIQSKKFSKAA